MKKNIFYFLITLLFLPACKKDTPVEIDFKLSAETGKAPMKISITNNTKGADTYLWTFEGGEPATSMEKSPEVTYYHSGTYTIKLEASGHETKELSKTIKLSASNKELLVDKKWKYVSIKLYVENEYDTVDVYANTSDFVRDDYYIFKTDNTYELNDNILKENESDPDIIQKGTWSFNKMQTILSLVYSEWHIVKLNEDTLFYKKISLSPDSVSLIKENILIPLN